MTRDDIIRMAREAGFEQDDSGALYIADRDGGCDAELARFAALVAAAEREACARVADKQDGDDEGDVGACTWSKAARHIATAIRARS